jgi:polyribonucleotide nucleotidyltransferase
LPIVGIFCKPPNQNLLNPTYAELAESQLNMVVAGTAGAVLMVESEAKELSEDEMLGAVLFAQQEMQVVIQAVKELAAEAGKPRWDVQIPSRDDALWQSLESQFETAIGDAYRITDKMARYESLHGVRAQAIAALAPAAGEVSADDVKALFKELESVIVRRRILNGEPRIDGRDNQTVRGIAVETGVLPRTHGSSLFTRGETQAMVVATLGSSRDAQFIDALEGERKDHFMLHYNFPPYSVGEAGRVGFTSRREVGHGRLARRGVSAVLPSADDFPYTIRVVSEITESNGSSSMASVCGASLALMDAGVPIKAPVAGIAMGLVKDGDRFSVLTDILGDEDHLGDMDFKVAGTAEGITALQMDIKIEGINEQIMERALDQALHARLHILAEMNRVIAESRGSVADTAPRMTSIKIEKDKIREIIGPGGAVIRGITEKSGAQIDIDDDGTIRIYAPNAESLALACNEVESITAEAEIGAIYTGTVARIVDFGAFVNILPGKDGLVHISQIAHERIEKVADHLSEGQEVKVKVLDVDARGRIKLSMKEVAEHEASES